MYQDAFDALGRLGLKRDEARVYLTCLRHKGGAFVHEITRESVIKRSTIDLIIQRLLARNFLSSFRDGQRRKFMAEPPESLLFDFQRGLEDFRNIIPLLARLGTSKDQTRITFHEGAQGVKAVFDTILITLKNLPEKERICYCISSLPDVERVRPRFRREFIEQRIQHRIMVHMITPRGEPGKTWDTSKNDWRISKMFDGKKYPFDIEISIVDDKVIFISTSKPIGGVTVQNRTIANSMRAAFKLLWDLMGEPEPDMDAVIAAGKKKSKGK